MTLIEPGRTRIVAGGNAGDYSAKRLAQEITAQQRIADARQRAANGAFRSIVGSTAVYDTNGVLRGYFGVLPDGTFGIVAENGAEPPSPTAPTVVSQPGAAVAFWDGRFVRDQVPPGDFAAVELHLGTTFDFVVSATSLVSNITGSVLFPLPDYATYYVRTATLNTSGRRSVPSQSVAVVADPITDVQLGPGSITADMLAFDAAGATVYYGVEAPPGTAFAVNDLWLRATDRQLHRWDGDSWESAQDAGLSQAISDAAIAQEAASQAAVDAARAITSAQTAQTLADSKAVIYAQDSPPVGMTPGDVGDLWIETDNGRLLHRWDGTNWQVIDDERISLALLTARGKITTYYQASQPVAVTVGDLWFDTDDQNKLYRFDGTQWITARDLGIATAQQNATQAIADSALATVAAAAAERKASEATANAATALTNAQTAQTIADGKATVYAQPTAPQALTPGDTNDLWLDSDDGNKVYRWTGTAWVLADDQRISSALAEALNAQTTADKKITAFYQASPPPLTGRAFGDMWVETDNGNLLWRWQNAWVPTPYAAAALDVRVGGPNLLSNSGFRSPLTPRQVGVGGASTVVDPTLRYGLDRVVRTTTNDPARAQGFSQDADTGVTVTSGTVCVVAVKIKGTAGRTVVIAGRALTDTGTIIGTNFGEQTITLSGEWQTIASRPWTITGQAFTPGVTWSHTGGLPNGEAAFTAQPQAVAGDLLPAYGPRPDEILAGTIVKEMVAFTARDLGSITTYFQASQPTGALQAGDLWVDTDDGNRSWRYSGTAWVPVDDERIALALIAAAEAQGTADRKVVTFAQADPPVGASPGDLWIDTENGRLLHRWDGTAWEVLDDQRIDTALDDAARAIADAAAATVVANQAAADTANAITSVQDAQSTADGKAVVYYQATPPTGLGAADLNDLWMDSDDGNRVYRWTGTVWSVSDDQRIGAALATANGAVLVDTAVSNPIFSKWTAAYPDGFTAWLGPAPVKELTVRRASPNAMRFVAPANTDQGVQFGTAFLPAAPVEYFTVTVDFQLVSGQIAGAGVVLDWTGMVGGRALLALADQNANVQPGRWYRSTKVLRRPTAATGTATGMGGYFMASWAGLGPLTAKDLVVDQFSIRAATVEEIAAYNAASAASVTALTSTVDKKITAFYQVSPPATTDRTIGDLWIDTDDANTLYRWDGAAWQSTRFGAGAIQSGATTIRRPPTILVARSDGSTIVDRLLELGYNVTVNQAATVATCRGYDVVVVDRGFFSADADSTFVQQLWQDGQKVLVGGNDTGVGMFYVTATTTTGGAPIGPPRMSTPHPVGTGWVEGQVVATDSGNVITAVTNYTKVLGSYVNYPAGMSILEVPHPRGGVVLHYGDVGITSGVGGQAIRKAAIEYLVSLFTSAPVTFDARQLGAITTYYQTTAPTAGVLIGDLWVDSDGGNLTYRWSGAAWVLLQDSKIGEAIANAANAQATADQKIITFAQDNPPARAPEDVGDIWIATGIGGNRIYRWSGTAWVPMPVKEGALDAGAVTDTKIASIRAEKITTGSLLATLTISGRMATALTGARVELNSTGLHGYNQFGSRTFLLDTTGSVAMTGGAFFGGTVEGGTVRTGPEGTPRVELSDRLDRSFIRFFAGQAAEESNPLLTASITSKVEGPLAEMRMAGPTYLGQASNGGVPSLFLTSKSDRTTQVTIASPSGQVQIAAGNGTGRSIYAFNPNDDATLGAFRTRPYLICPSDEVRYNVGLQFTELEEIRVVNANASAYKSIKADQYRFPDAQGISAVPDGMLFAKTGQWANLHAKALIQESSRRYKHHIEPTSYDGLEVVRALQVVDYEYLPNTWGGTGRRVGLIAEDTDRVFPEAVHHDRDGRPDGIAYADLVAPLIRAVQQLAERVDTLTGRR